MNTLDFSIIEVPQKINAEWVLGRLSSEQIFYAYFGEFVPYKGSYNSVFRRDRTASTGFYYGENGKLKYKDLGTGESWDCFSFIAKLYNISYYEAVKKTACDFGLIKGCGSLPFEKKSINQSIKFDKVSKEDTIIDIEHTNWTEKQYEYWNQYEITKEELDREDVIPAVKVRINGYYISSNHLRFAYQMPVKDKIYYKLYSPYADKFKWISSIPLHIPFGVHNLNYNSDTVYITKSLKDMIVLKKIFPSVIATQNESEGALNNGMIKFLHKHFKKRIIIFDNDETGKESCKKFNSKGFGYFNIPNEFIFEGIKDPSDFIKSYGIDKLKELFKQKNLL